MASKKDFRGKKPENAIEANAVEAFLDKAPQAEEQPLQAEETPTLPADLAEKTYKPVSKRKPDMVLDQRRNKRVQLLTTQYLFDYITNAAWKDKRSVNDYINMLIEKDKEAKEREGK